MARHRGSVFSSRNLEVVSEGDDADDAAEAHLETTGVEIPYQAM